MHDLIWGTDTLFFRDNGFLSDSQASLLGQSYQELYAEKTATKLSIYKKLYNNLYVRYALEYTYSAYVQDAYPSYYDVWGVNVPVLCSFNGEDFTDIAALFRSAEAEMAIRLPRSGGDESQTYVGGDFHGFENIVSDNDVRQFRILVDNVKIEETGTFSLRPIVSASIIQKSELCQAYSNSNPFARVLKEWHFDRNGIEITTSLEILRSVTFMNAMLGMFGVYRHWLGNSSNPYLTNRVVKDDNIFTEYDISDGWENVAANAPLKTADINCRKMTLWGQYPYGFALQIIEPTVKPNGGMKIATNGSTYNKVYYDLTGTYTTEANEKLSCTQKWVIE